MPTYHVSWEIEIDAENPRDAAKQALAIQRDPHSLATVFQVLEFDTEQDAVTIDLQDATVECFDCGLEFASDEPSLPALCAECMGLRNINRAHA